MNVWLHPAENCPGFGRRACPAAGYWTQSCSGSCGAPGSPSEATGLLEVQKPCLASKSCLPSLRRSCLCLNAYFQLCVSAPSPREPGGPGMRTAPLASARLRRRVPQCSDTGIPVRRNRAAREGSPGCALLAEVGSRRGITWARVQCDTDGN